jgi:hypothetical protein
MDYTSAFGQLLLEYIYPVRQLRSDQLVPPIIMHISCTLHVYFSYLSTYTHACDTHMRVYIHTEVVYRRLDRRHVQGVYVC